MARTIRAYHDRMCFRGMSNHPHKKLKAMLTELERELYMELKVSYPVRLGNRCKLRAEPEPYDDIAISALSETKHIWKHDRAPRPRNRYRED